MSCTPRAADPHDLRPAPADVASLVAAFFATARAGDRDAFQATLSPRDPSFADRARLLYSNLSTLPLSRLEVATREAPQALDARPGAVLGPGAWAQPVTLRWQLRGEQAVAEHRVWLTLVVDDRLRVAGAFEPPPGTDRSPQPTWWRGPVTVADGVGVRVVLGSGQPAGRWVPRAVDALRRVRRHLPPPLDREVGAVIVEVPASLADFAAVVGAAPDSYAQVAAAAVVLGAGADAAVHIVVNPEAERRLAPAGLAVALAHETVHVVTRSPVSPAPTWAVEGLADYVALRALPGARADVFAPLRAQVRRGRSPATLPADAAFAADAPALAVAYGTAWSFCQFAADAYGAARLGRLYAALDAGHSPQQAARSVLGVSEGDLLAGWRRDLTRRAGS